MALSTITADYSAYSSFITGSSGGPSIDLLVGRTSNESSPFRSALRFNLSPVPSNADVSKIELVIDVRQLANVSTESWRVGGYASHGLEDPQQRLSSGNDVFYTDCQPTGSQYLTTTEFRSLGEHTLDVTTAGSLSDISSSLSGLKRFSVYCTAFSEANGKYIQIKSHSSTVSPNPPKLKITYTVPAVIAISRAPGRRALFQLLAG